MASVKKIDPKSENACHNGLNVFTLPPTNVSVLRSTKREVLPLNTVDESPYEFRVNGDSQWLDLSYTKLYIQCQIQKRDGVQWVNLTAADTLVAPVQTLGQSFIRQLKVSLNGTETYDSGTLYPFMTYIKNELNYSPIVKDTAMAAGGYYREERVDDATSAGFVERNRLMGQSEVVEFEAPLDFDLANQPLFLLPNVEVLFTIYKHDDNFLIQTLLPNDTNVYRLKVHNVRLRVKTVEVGSTVNVAVADSLEKTTAKYYMRKTEARSCYLTPGRTEFVYNVFANQKPRRVILAMVNNHSYNGHIAKNPFNFQPFDVREISLNVGGVVHPTFSYNMRWVDLPKSFIRAYSDMQDATMLEPLNTTNGISLPQFIDGWTFFVFPLSPTLEDNNWMELAQTNSTTLTVRFNRPIPDPGVSLICIGEFDQVIYIDQNRNVATDGTVS